jgi:hypothetical protein
MIISQPAVFCLQATWNRFVSLRTDDDELRDAPRMATGSRRTSQDALPNALELAQSDAPVSAASASVVTTIPPTVPAAPLTAAERRARAAALRALALSRGRRFDAAESAFAEAARLDPTLDLTRTPRFWQLERAAHEAAINAYLQVGRERDAAVLRARVMSTFRPKPLRTRQAAVLTP